MLGKVFDLFVQVEPSIDRSAGGLGIGLTLVERLVAMHGGSVSAQSEGLGKGSEFTVRLPLARKATLGAQVPAPLPLQEPAPVQKRRVVVVEDNEDVRALMKELLEDMGHEVALATDGLEGVTKVLEVLPDVALVDVGLPGIDGYEVARRVRATQEGNPLCLVALTGYGGADAKAMAREAGFDLHLAKPIHVDDLTRVIESPPGKRTGRPSGAAV
jgi:CheY-like chemotaxis protein